MTVCHASKVDLEIRLEIPLVEADGQERIIIAAMSLKRHTYKLVREAEIKEQNSVCCHTIAVPNLCVDAKEIGDQLVAAYAADRTLMDAGKTRDFTSATGRVFRFDNLKGAKDFNHFYPLRGTGVWNCDAEEFGRLQALRRYQKNDEDGDSLRKFVGWAAVRDNTAAWQALRKKLVDCSGAEATLTAIELLARPKRKDSLDGFHTGFSDDEDDAPRLGARSRSNSNASSGSSSGYSSASTSRSNSRSPSPVRATATASDDESGFSWDSD